MKNVRHVPDGMTVTPTPAPVSTNESSEFPEDPSTFPTLVPTAHRELPLSGVLLEIGSVLANRYEILEILGEGGMGAVYKAQDLQLEREVALKVIRPELASDPEILQRFKHELILARQVTDRNVIRIFDLGEAGAIRFITMEFVDGESLHKILRRQGKLEVAEALDIVEQVARGLAAVHREGVLHRDLKPANIMRDKQGRVVVMDFGLARSFAGDGMTQTGTMLGTIEYMSPEQAQCKELTAASDIFSLGLILYQLLSGVMPFYSESVITSLLMRAQQRAVSLTEIDKNIPNVLSNIVCKCLETDPALRYKNADELLADIHAWTGKGGNTRISASPARMRMNRMRRLPWTRVAFTAFLALIPATGIVLYLMLHPAKVKTHAPVSVLVADFQNNTGDSLFDDTLEPMFNVALEGASFINGFNRGTARKAAAGLPNPAHTLDEQASRQVAIKEGIAAIVTGSLSKHGSGYNLSVKAIDAVTGKTLTSADANTANKDALLLEVPKLAVPIRQALGDTTPKSVQLNAAQGTFSTSNLEAVHQYSVGMEQQFQGKSADALQSFTRATQLDPNFARAYAGMAAASGNLGQLSDAEKYVKLAMQHIDQLTERERYRVRAHYYVRTQNWQKCVEEYSELVRGYPADNVGYGNLATCYARMLNMPKAMEAAREGLKIAPNNVFERMNSSLYSCYTSDFQSCERGGREVLQLNPSYEHAFLVVAYAQLGQGQVSQAAGEYQQLEKVSPRGASLAAAGLGNIALYQGRFKEGIQILEKGAAVDLEARNPIAAADKVLLIAYANLWRGDKQAAAAAARRAIALRQSAKVRFLAARVLVEADEMVEARQLANGLASEIYAEPQAYAKLIVGEVALHDHNTKEAIQFFTEARNQLDTWIGRFDLGRAYLAAEAFGEADSEFDRCIARRGEALEFFLDDLPTYSFLPPAYYYQGRILEGLGSKGFADSYHTYLSIRGQSMEDPLVAEIQRRLRQ
jgi:serine/threonine protein kinase/Tfp pilus assembly protein PilF